MGRSHASVPSRGKRRGEFLLCFALGNIFEYAQTTDTAGYPKEKKMRKAQRSPFFSSSYFTTTPPVWLYHATFFSFLCALCVCLDFIIMSRREMKNNRSAVNFPSFSYPTHTYTQRLYVWVWVLSHLCGDRVLLCGDDDGERKCLANKRALIGLINLLFLLTHTHTQTDTCFSCL